jgi:hypothetical protein
MIDVYFWPTGNGKKVTPEYDAINPNNKMPALIDRDAPRGPLGGLGSMAGQAHHFPLQPRAS